MDIEELLTLQKAICQEAYERMREKNHDYAGASGKTPFANFEIAEKLGVTNTATSILIRATDKFARIVNFNTTREFKVKDENLRDTVRDFINYLIIYYAHVSKN